MTWFIAGIVLLLGGALLVQWFVTAEPKQVLRAAKVLGLLALVGLAVFLVLSGRLGWAFATIPAFVVWALRFYSVVQMVRRVFRFSKAFSRMGNPTGQTGQASSINTRFIHMTLDHDSGAMDGVVAEGPHQGRRLNEMTLAELLALREVCINGDAESVRVLDAYLDRTHENWRADAAHSEENGDAFADGPMSEDEALKILGLERGADEKTVKAAHRRLMAAVHPDHGGSTYLAAKINQAKDVLLQSL